MPNLWTLGGLSLRELLRRTCSESWHDAVFGQAGRMAFYHFLAIFPSLLIFLATASRIPALAPVAKQTFSNVAAEFLPNQASFLVNEVMRELSEHSLTGIHFLFACASGLWAALNGTWALVWGLNRAYEVEEHRPWWKVGLTIVGLAFSLALAGTLALLVLLGTVQLDQHLFGRPWFRVVEWLIVLALLTFCFAVVYRFAPNLRDHEWKWSTPGALCALVLWIAATVGLRFYFQHVNDYTRTYGHLNAVVMLLLWLYLTNGAILIGGEMNSEIEKAAAEGDGNPHRSGS